MPNWADRPRPFGVILALAVLLGTPAVAETITLAVEQPARYAEPSLLRRLRVGPFSGDGGAVLASEIAAQLNSEKAGVRHFDLIDGPVAGAGAGVLTGDVQIAVVQGRETQQRSRCLEPSGLLGCKRREPFSVSCLRQRVTVTASVQMLRVADQRIVYATRYPVDQSSFWCEGDQGVDPQSLAQSMIGRLATQIAGDISPSVARYQVRMFENTRGLNRPAVPLFKAAIKTSVRDLTSSCASWQTLATQGEQAAALSYSLGICAEQAGNLSDAAQHFARAATLMPGERLLAAATNRIRVLQTARAQFEAQAAQRTAAEAAERQRVEAEQAALRRGAAAGQRRARAAEAAAKAKERQRQAAAAAAQGRARQAVVDRYGANAADAIIARQVVRGMTPAQVRAAVGGGCNVEELGPGEERWTCNGRRIVFARGRVTFVR